MTKFSRLITWAEVFAWIGLIFSLSGESFGASRTWIALKFWVDYFALPASPATLLEIHLAIRKSAHFIEFFVLGMLLARALVGNLQEFRFKAGLWVLGAGLLCALADEGHQMLVVSRTPSLRDSFLDFSGVLASQICLYVRTQLSGHRFAASGGQETAPAPGESP